MTAPQPTMEHLVATIKALEGRLEQLQELQEEQATPRARKVKIRNPDTFDGNRQKLQGFVSQLERYIRIYSDQFEYEEDKVLFASTYLRGTAERWFEPYLNEHLHKPKTAQSQTTKDMFNDYSKFVTHLKRAFNDVDEVRQATQKIMGIQQKGSVADYTSNFRQAAAFLEGWSDQAQRDHFYKGLKPNIKDAMAFHSYPEKLDDMIELARRLDDRFWERRSEHYPANITRPARPRHTQEGGDAMEIDNVNRGGNQNQRRGKNRNNKSRGPRPEWTEEQKQRFKDKLCIHCGKDWKYGHNCPQNPRNRKEKNSSVANRETATTARQLDNHDSLSWTACYNDNYRTHQSDKDATGWYPKKPRKRQIAPATRNEEVVEIDDFINDFPRDEELVNSDTGEIYDSTPEPEENLETKEREEPLQKEELLDTMLSQASNRGLTWKLPAESGNPAKGIWIPGIDIKDCYMVEWEIRDNKPYERRSHQDGTRTKWIQVPEGEYPAQDSQQSKN